MSAAYAVQSPAEIFCHSTAALTWMPSVLARITAGTSAARVNRAAWASRPEPSVAVCALGRHSTAVYPGQALLSSSLGAVFTAVAAETALILDRPV